MRSHLLALLLVAGVVPCVNAQSERYELAARLKAFEAEWEKQTDKDARKRAVKILPDATTQFFTFQQSKAAQTLDNARFALMSDQPPSDAVLWATSLYPEVKTRLLVGDVVEVTVKQFYKVKAEQPKDVRVSFWFKPAERTNLEVEKLPVKQDVEIPLIFKTPVDLRLTMEVSVGGKVLVTRTVGVSAFDEESLKLFSRVEKRLAKSDNVSFEMETYKGRLALVRSLIDGTIPETDVRAADLYIQTLGIVLDSHTSVFEFGPNTPGDLRVSIPTDAKGKIVTPCRLFVPEKLDAKKPVPLVVAMHGAGGSENMFFESYGNGHIVKLCKERGWLLVSPRAGLGFGLTPAPPVADIVDELAKRYPVDPKRVFILGHSMGSSMAFDAVQKDPGKFAAVACLAGGGSVRKAEVFAELPVFIGVGDKDFASKTAKGLQTNLEKAKSKNVTFKEYPDVEHLLIVREALGDVFDLFDKLAK